MYLINLLLMLMYHICFDVNVKSMGYMLKEKSNSQTVPIGRISCRCCDGSVFCFLTFIYMTNTLDHETEQIVKTSNNWKFILVYNLLYYVYRVSASTPLSTYMHHAIVIITSNYDELIK